MCWGGGEALRHPGRPTGGQEAPSPPRGTARDGATREGPAPRSPRKWLTQRWRSVLGMWQMVAQRCLMDSGCPGGSPEPVSSLSNFTPFSKMFATCSGSPQRPRSERPTPAGPWGSPADTRPATASSRTGLTARPGPPPRAMALERLFRDSGPRSGLSRGAGGAAFRPRDVRPTPQGASQHLARGEMCLK